MGDWAGAVARWLFPQYAAWDLVAVHESFQCRREAATCIRNGRLIISGGCQDDHQYLTSLVEFDLQTRTWREGQPCPVSCAGHSLISYENKVIALIGIATDERLRVYEFDATWSLVSTLGDSPASTCGHSATLVGKDVWVFGGEDFRGKRNNELHVLHLETMSWERIITRGTAPPPRSYHGAAHLTSNDRLYLFGGQTDSACNSSNEHIFYLNLAEKCWCSRSQRRGVARPPQALFGSATVGEKCYVVGGGTEHTFMMDLRSLEWSVLSVEPRLHGKGLSLGETNLDGQETLIATWSDDTTGRLAVFMLKTKAAYRTPRLSTVPVAYPPTDQDQWTSLTGEHKVSNMSVMECRRVLAQIGVKIVSCCGWLEPRMKVEAPSFDWRERSMTISRYLSTYIKRTGGFGSGPLLYCTKLVYKVSCPFEDLTLKVDVTSALVVERYGILPPFLAFRTPEFVTERDRWRALVVLLGLNIVSPDTRPWVLLSDLKEHWEFGWMDGKRMFVCKVSRGEAFGITADLFRDYHLLTAPSLYGETSKLPSAATRHPVDVPCDSECLADPVSLFMKTYDNQGRMSLFCVQKPWLRETLERGKCHLQLEEDEED